MMLNRKGFTLTEVLVVIAIIALLVLILVPNVFVLVNKNKEQSCNTLVEDIKASAKVYVTNNKYDLGFSCAGEDNTKYITVKTLLDSGDLKLGSNNRLINPIDDTEVPSTTTVKVTYDCNSKTFSYVLDSIECTINE